MTSTTTDDRQISPASSGTGEQLVRVLTLPFAVAQRVLPSSSKPVLLGAGALALAGVIEWPVAGAVGLAYLALRGSRPER